MLDLSVVVRFDNVPIAFFNSVYFVFDLLDALAKSFTATKFVLVLIVVAKITPP